MRPPPIWVLADNNSYSVRTFFSAEMSLLGQKRTSRREPKSTVVRFGPKADKRGRNWIVRFVPGGDIGLPLQFNRLPILQALCRSRRDNAWRVFWKDNAQFADKPGRFKSCLDCPIELIQGS